MFLIKIKRYFTAISATFVAINAISGITNAIFNATNVIFGVVGVNRGVVCPIGGFPGEVISNRLSYMFLGGAGTELLYNFLYPSKSY